MGVNGRVANKRLEMTQCVYFHSLVAIEDEMGEEETRKFLRWFLDKYNHGNRLVFDSCMSTKEFIPVWEAWREESKDRWTPLQYEDAFIVISLIGMMEREHIESEVLVIL